MSRPCGFCGRYFNSKQGVRSHLEFCKEYIALKKQGLAGPGALKKQGASSAAYQAPEPDVTVYRCEMCNYEQDEDFQVCPNCAARST